VTAPSVLPTLLLSLPVVLTACWERGKRRRPPARGVDGIHADDTRLLCFSGAGFTDDLRRIAASDHTVQLIDVERLYYGT
jgi:hypothetical protein